MTTTVSLDGLRELAAFRAETGCAISLYLDLDPRVAPTAADVATRVRSLLDAGERSHGATRGDLAHEVRVGLRRDFERLERYFEEEFDRDGAQGLAVFSAGLDNVWHVLPLPEPVPEAVRVADDFLLAPLVPLVGRGSGALVGVVNREQGRLYALRGGRLEQVADLTENAPNRHDQSGWSEARIQRHVENVAHEHYKAVGDELERLFRRLGRPRIVIVCSDEVRHDFASVLATEVCDAIVGWATAEQHAGPAELHEAAAPLLESWHAEREREALERWREGAGRGERSSAGWADTLEAASDARVELLLYADGASSDAHRCPSCGRVALDAGACPLDGTTTEPRDDGLDLGVRLALASGGEVLAIRHRRDLEPVGGIGAILRF